MRIKGGVTITTYHPELEKYIALVHFLGEVLGKNSEVVLHSLHNLEQSIVAIHNSHISGRKVGGHATDLVLQIMKNKSLQQKQYVTNYTGQSKNKDSLQSSTFFIRDENGELIGMLCINTDLNPIRQMADSIRQLEDMFGLTLKEGKDESYIENLSSSVEDITLNSIETIVSNKNVSPTRMTQEEKIEIVDELNKKGVFLLKGAVSITAKQLNVSEATIYRYLQKVK